MGEGKQLLVLIAVSLFVLPFLFPLNVNAAAVQTSSTNFFSIVQISDTQYLSAKYPSLFTELTNWIVNVSDRTNLKMVIHTGDIVDATNLTQWQNANKSMSVLLNANIPYSWVAGNHDQFGNILGGSCGNPDLGWAGSRFLPFNATDKRAHDYWVDDYYDSKNTAVKFTYNQFPFLIIGLEYHANSSVMAWAQNLLDKSAGSNVIIAAHSYLNDTNGYGYYGDYSWENNLKALIDGYPNVFLTLSGHDDQIGANNTKVGNREEIFFDRQDLDQQKGAASARIYTFNLTSLQVTARTFLVYEKTFLNDSYNNFTFDAHLQRDTANNIFPYSHFWVGPDYNSYISFSESCKVSSVDTVGSQWIFNNLTLNGITSNLVATSNNANLEINNYDPNNGVSGSVNGNGNVALSLDRAPVSVLIDGAPVSDGWAYDGTLITLTAATSSIDIKCNEFVNKNVFSIPLATSTPSAEPSISSIPSFKPTTSPTALPVPRQTSLNAGSDLSATAAPTENNPVNASTVIPIAIILIPFFFFLSAMTFKRVTNSKRIEEAIVLEVKSKNLSINSPNNK